ncbi:radical SAM protein [Paenibacillus motobuensis]|uniref:Radical SAM protein n=1 Tax=Paenibacillus motobuensis TaxID=295324 RepID=A0ABN0YQ89_9BACL
MVSPNVDKKISILGNMHKSDWERLGTVFETKNNKYFYDTGTGKVFLCDVVESEILESLLTSSDPAAIAQLDFTDAELESALNTILALVEQEKILQAPSFQEFITPKKSELPGIISGGIEQVILELTENCNLRCKYCIYQEDNTGYRSFSKKDMDWETAKKALDYISRNVGESLALTFYGGEPLINFELMRQCIEYSKDIMSEVSISVSFTTNLTLVTDEIAEYLASLEKCSVLCSLDGPKNIQDYYRVTVGGNGSFNRAMKGLRRLVEAFQDKPDHSLGINSVVCPPYSIEKIDELNDFFKSLDWLPPDTNINCSYVDQGDIDWEQMGVVRREISFEEFYDSEEVADPLGVWAFSTIDKDTGITGMAKDISQTKLMRIHNRVITDEPLLGIHMNGCCIPGQRRLYVTTEGDFKVCERMSNSPYIGDIERGIDIEAVYRSYYEEYSNKSLQHCANCWAVRLCGICFATCYQTDGLDENKKMNTCYAEKAITKFYLQRYHQLIEDTPEKIQYFNEMIIS